MKLKICEIFKSIQGESSFIGLPSVFIRLSGCNLRCAYCDTSYAWEDGHDMTIHEIVEHVMGFKCGLALLTGGEPLLQEESHRLMHTLIGMGFRTMVETNGSLDISRVPEGAITIMDVKCPGSGQSDKFHWDNLNILKPSDEVKFVITGRDDYDWSLDFINQNLTCFNGQILFSPAFGLIEPRDLVSWILKDNLEVRFQLQLHKYVWGPNERGV